MSTVMSKTAMLTPTVIRTERGLTIAGTRITLYDILDYLKADWPPSLIGDWFDLTDIQLADVLDYIEAHAADVEDEYQQVLEQAQNTRSYWEDRNRERLERIASLPPKPGREELYAKVQARKAELGLK